MPIRMHQAPAEVHRVTIRRDATTGDDVAFDLDDEIGRGSIGLLGEELPVLLDLVQENVLGMIRRTDRDAGVDVGVSEGANG